MAHWGCRDQAVSSAVLDVREVPPRIRHPKIFEAFDALAPGESFTLVNDHDPRPLFYQFQAERPNAVGWRYLEEGPEVWRVEIAKIGTVAIDPNRTVAATLAARPDLRPLFDDLGINHCCGAHLTLTEAAASAGVPPDRVLAAIRGRPAPTPAADPQPGALDDSPRVVVDVRDDIRRGVEPFARIMTAVKHLRPGQALVLRAPFEPLPLYGVLGKRGFAHATEARGPDDWWVTFYRAAPDTSANAESAATPPDPPTEASITLDVRGLEPPHPMVRVLEAAERLPAGGELVVIHDRRPLFLYPQLEERGFVHDTQELEPGVVRIRIRRAGRPVQR